VDSPSIPGKSPFPVGGPQSLRRAEPTKDYVSTAKGREEAVGLPDLLRRSSVGYEGRELQRRHGGIFQHSLKEVPTNPFTLWCILMEPSLVIGRRRIRLFIRRMKAIFLEKFIKIRTIPPCNLCRLGNIPLCGPE